MQWLHGQFTITTERRERIELGYRRFRYGSCHREFNERTGTQFNYVLERFLTQSQQRLAA